MKNLLKKNIIVLSVLFSIIFLCVSLFIIFINKYGSRFNIYLTPPSPQKYVQVALNFMDSGIYATGATWEEAKQSAIDKSRNLSDYASTYDLLEEALAVAGGKHSALFLPNERNAEVAKQEYPTVNIDEQGILYVKLPSFLGTEGAQQYADMVVEYVIENLEHIEGVIIDLQDNTGGNLGPMLGAMSPFLPDGQLLSFRIRDYEQAVKLSEGTVTGGGSNMKVAPVKVTNIPIAILQNEWTASSAEAVLLAFRGLENVQTFGKPSAGYCSCNTVFYLYNGAMLQLTVGSNVARTGEEFCENPIAPDIDTETPMKYARDWIAKSMNEQKIN